MALRLETLGFELGERQRTEEDGRKTGREVFGHRLRNK